jgi:hypothetical protein
MDAPRPAPPPDPYALMSAYRRQPELVPLWQELPWHLRHPALAAFLFGSLITGALWLLTHA